MTPERSRGGVQAAKNRAKLLRRIRSRFEVAKVLEVDTPALSPYAVSDPHIESFEIPGSVVSRTPLFLHTSPEFCMKRLLCEGYPDIFSICRVFRDGESGQQHQPEFTMIEWYRRGFGLREIIDDTIGLIGAALTSDAIVSSAVQCDYRSSFMQALGIDPLVATADELATASGADATLRKTIGPLRDDWLDLLLATRITPAFPAGRLTVLRHFPASQAALARLCPADARVADRFEVFLGPLELANGYVELTDPEEQRRRMRDDQEDRRRRNLPLRPHDLSLLAALEAGMPDCAGVAIGLERLQMSYDGTDDIRDVIPLPFEPPE